MSELRPKGLPLTLMDGVERHVLFTLSVVDDVQSHFDKPISKIIAQLADEKTVYQTLSYLTLALVNDELLRNGEKKMLTEQDIKWNIEIRMAKRIITVILKAYGYSMPEPDEDDEPDDLENQDQLNIARLLYIGSNKLGYTEDEIFAMTPRKFFKIYDEYLEMNGIKKETQAAIDMLP